MKTGKKASRKDAVEDQEFMEQESLGGQGDDVVESEVLEADGVDEVSVEEASVDEPAREAILEERLIRLQADFDNFRKRTLREREDLYRRANEDIMLELLPVLDHLELAFRAAGAEGADHPLVKGFALVGEQVRQTLKKFGLVEVASEGVDFDPNVHEAIQHLPSESVPENGVIAATRAGYMLGSRLLRAAQVVVSSGPQEESIEADEG